MPAQAGIPLTTMTVRVLSGIPAFAGMTVSGEFKTKKPEFPPAFFIFSNQSEAHEHPLVLPQVSHFMQVPLRTIV
jgi:hypothetical protein